MNLASEAPLFILRSDFLHTVKSYDMGVTALPWQEGVPRIFIAFKIHRLSQD
jgi:hypothetical protein